MVNAAGALHSVRNLYSDCLQAIDSWLSRCSASKAGPAALLPAHSKQVRMEKGRAVKVHGGQETVVSLIPVRSL